MTSSATPIIRGFAVTLGLGVLVSMFTAVVVTRTLLRLVIRQPWGRHPSWYGVKVPDADRQPQKKVAEVQP
jgi:preprotein translocase subunit SecD